MLEKTQLLGMGVLFIHGQGSGLRSICTGNTEDVHRKEYLLQGYMNRNRHLQKKKKKKASCMEVFLNREWTQEKRPVEDR